MEEARWARTATPGHRGRNTEQADAQCGSSKEEGIERPLTEHEGRWWGENPAQVPVPENKDM